MADAYISSIPTDADMDIISRCIEANITMQADTHPLKHGDGKPVCRPARLAEQEVAEMMKDR